jgi:hypothetical protein
LGILGELAAWSMGIPLVVACNTSRFVKGEIVRRTALVHALISKYI